MAGLLGRLTRRALGPVGRIGAKVAMTAFRASPVGAVATVAGIAGFEAFKHFRGRGGGVPQLPALPMSAMDAGAGMPTGGGGGVMDAFALQAAGKKSIAMPNLTIEQMNALQAAGLMTEFAQLRTYHRSPRKDHVVVHPQLPDGRVLTFGLHKKLAQRWELWKPAKKPPISVGMMSALRKAKSFGKKLREINSDYKSIANFGAHKSPWEAAAQAASKKAMGKALERIAGK